MKTLKFCISLFGLFLLVNAPLKAQELPDLPLPNVSIESISVGNRSSSTGNAQVTIIVHSDIPYELVAAIYTKSVEIDFESSGNITTNHTFEMTAPAGKSVMVRCGYMDVYGNYQEEGGCIITIEPGFSLP